MRLKAELYATKGKTFAENIDRAWGIYRDNTQDEEERRVAQSFLIYAFNLQRLDEVNEQLIALMAERNLHKAKNPEYIPGLSPKNVDLDPDNMILPRTAWSKRTTDLKLKKLFDAGEMLDVNNEDKREDYLEQTKFFSRVGRAQYRVHIYQGLFHQGGEVFDTTNYTAHGKIGYAAYTINANGELSIFKHHGGTDDIVHSSMNAGSPVVCAGELSIKEGKLLAINTYSGHYQPRLFNVYRALEFFSDKGIDLSQTKIQTVRDPTSDGLKVSSSSIQVPSIDGRMRDFFEISAGEFFKLTKAMLSKELQSIEADINEYQSLSFKTRLYNLKDFMTRSTLTSDRRALSVRVKNTVEEMLQALTNNHAPNKEKISNLLIMLEKINEENTNLSTAHGKKTDSGRLHSHLQTFIRHAQVLAELSKPPSDDDLTRMKMSV